MAEAPPTPASDSDPSPSLAPAAPRSLPTTLSLPRPSTGSRPARGGSTVSGSGRKKGKAPAAGSATAAEGTTRRHGRLVEAVRLIGGGADPAVAGTDILELAMAKGAMFSWLGYWPEGGYPKEGQPY
ncbi:uncharacterized protein [Lolium perenne]|uniref:uncharacterized protein n=1 Tax=Lolium perenne TaxID=4522 RepID=UPI0021F5C14C|nr:uncharacterized protein LOC127299482 [Lolium perenne]XP_051185416.1 uncharacterized protein LOC127299482 [Lolium perenne]